ncbi:hypothetical protein PG984_002384 [Apiospora sp. TS-2023a]
MRFPQQTMRLRRPSLDDYDYDSDSQTPTPTGDDTTIVESPLPLGTQPRFTMLLRSSASLRRLKGKEVADYGPMPPENEKCKRKRKRRYFCLGATVEHTCDHCGDVAESAHWRPRSDALSEYSVWDLDEVHPVDLRGAVFNLTIQLEQEKAVYLATIKLKYEKRRQRIPKWLGFSRGVLESLEKLEYGHKRRELDNRLLNEILHYEAGVKGKFADRRHSDPDARPTRGFLGHRAQPGIVFPNSI